jgi:hypothetical protein
MVPVVVKVCTICVLRVFHVTNEVADSSLWVSSSNRALSFLWCCVLGDAGTLRREELEEERGSDAAERESAAFDAT